MGTRDGQFQHPYGIAIGSYGNVYSSGNVYVADTDNHRIQVFAPSTK